MLPANIKSQALKLWGSYTQIDMGQEECAELIVALNKFKRNECPATIEAIANEVADVELMTEQLRFIFGFDKRVNEIKRYKIKRLKDRLVPEFKEE